jgi:hypothetical protein
LFTLQQFHHWNVCSLHIHLHSKCADESFTLLAVHYNQTSWSTGLHSCFIFSTSWVQISAQRLAILNAAFRGFPRLFEANAGKVH